MHAIPFRWKAMLTTRVSTNSVCSHGSRRLTAVLSCNLQLYLLTAGPVLLVWKEKPYFQNKFSLPKILLLLVLLCTSVTHSLITVCFIFKTTILWFVSLALRKILNISFRHWTKTNCAPVFWTLALGYTTAGEKFWFLNYITRYFYLVNLKMWL